MKKYNELVNIVNQANYDYHVMDAPKITDQEYDNYLRELYEYEDKLRLYEKRKKLDMIINKIDDLELRKSLEELI